jgi:hypothetical protein
MVSLHGWLRENDVSNVEFGARIGRSGEAVRRYAAGERIPDKETMPRIVNETAGAVTPNDFFDLSLADHSAADPASTAATENDGEISAQAAAA